MIKNHHDLTSAMLQHTECVPISEDIKLACRMITVLVVIMPDHGTSVQQIKFVVYKKTMEHLSSRLNLLFTRRVRTCLD